ncbi:unnamed protein product [Trichogramma brassicae]|uniref:Uncharacterized protein n=1 Tax=Trichogramma brassicae TaxID=86971 RepID=A0A6H5I173_9HYME|nr:unnamed protein product [Trichogramma brassicae]
MFIGRNKLGHVKDPVENITYIDSNEMDINEFKRKLAPEDKLEAVKFKFKTTMLYDKIQLSKKYEVHIALMRPTMKRLYGGYPWAYRTTYWDCKLNVNGAMGHGLVELTEPYRGECPLARLPSPNGTSLLEPPSRPEGADEKSYNEVALLWLGNPRCKDEKLCGADVASLARLIQLRSTQFLQLQEILLTLESTRQSSHNSNFDSQVQHLSDNVMNLRIEESPADDFLESDNTEFDYISLDDVHEDFTDLRYSSDEDEEYDDNNEHFKKKPMMWR